MSKKKLAEIIGVCIIAISIIVVITILPSCDSTTPLVTLDCTDHTTNSLTAHATVNSLEAGPLSRRGFVYEEGTEGDPELNIVPLVNPSFELGDPPDGWANYWSSGGFSRNTTQVKVGNYSMQVIGQTGTVSRVGQRLDHNVGEPYYYLRGNYITVGAWVWTDVPNKVCLNIMEMPDYAQTFSSYHTGSGSWEWLTVTRSLTDREYFIVGLFIDANTPTVTAYCDDASLVENAVFEDGEFGTGSYSLVIEGLKPDTSYRVRAFVENEAGIGYGNTVTCKTLVVI